MNEAMIKTLKEREKHRTQQPYWVWESIQEIPSMLSQCLDKPVIDQIDNVVKEFKIRNINKILLLGRGSSFFTTISEQYLLEKIVGIPTRCFVTNVFESYPNVNINANTAVFFHSHSGKSEGDVQIVNFANQLGAYTIGITDIPTSSLADVVDNVIIGPGGSKVELPATRTYATAMFRMMFFATALGKEIGNHEIAVDFEESLHKIPGELETFILNFEPQAEIIAKEIQGASAFIIVGFGPNLSTADEAAMAFSQAYAVPAQAFEMENFIHGPMQAINKQQCVVAIAPNGPLQDRVLRLAQACKIIGTKTLVLAPYEIEKQLDIDIFIGMPSKIPDLISPVFYMVPLWQIGYQLGLFGKGGHPDRLSMDKEEFKKAFSFLMKKDKWVTQK
ncbi:MAG TPA: SIS domain-containing protein [Anaerolineae bacterium]|nr:SIS domain-containing protein [Anaerolineae bacterium]